jgi:site-specific recombinase XerD
VARKNGNGEGTRPRKRPDGRWESRYWIEAPTGRKRRSVYGSSRKECAEKLAEAMATKDDPPVIIPPNITVGEFLDQYLASVKETLKRRTWEGHEETVRVHLVPMLGHLKLKDLPRERVQALYTAKRDQGLSPGTVRRIHAVLSAALSHAVRWRLVPHNICKEVDPPRAQSPEIRPLNQKEARGFLIAAEGERYHALYCLALTSGMRRGEILGLKRYPTAQQLLRSSGRPR